VLDGVTGDPVAKGSRVCPDCQWRARCRSWGGHQIVVVPRVPCALRDWSWRSRWPRTASARCCG